MHLVRAVMKIAGRRMLKALVVDQVLSFYSWGFVFNFVTRALAGGGAAALLALLQGAAAAVPRAQRVRWGQGVGVTGRV